MESDQQRAAEAIHLNERGRLVSQIQQVITLFSILRLLHVQRALVVEKIILP